MAENRRSNAVPGYRHANRDPGCHIFSRPGHHRLKHSRPFVHDDGGGNHRDDAHVTHQQTPDPLRQPSLGHRYSLSQSLTHDRIWLARLSHSWRLSLRCNWLPSEEGQIGHAELNVERRKSSHPKRANDFQEDKADRDNEK